MRLRKEVPIGEGALVLQSGHVARQANGSCTVRLGDTVVLASACMAEGATPREFLPLTVEYREYSYAGGRIPGGFFKREGRPTEKEIITCRLIDRPLRPLFPEGYFNETQIILLVLSADGENDPDILAINGASTALVLSNIPFFDPIGGVRVGLIDGDVVFNPTNSQRDVSELDLVVVGTEEAVVMVEASANQLPEEKLLDCIYRGHQEVQRVIRCQHEMFREAGLRKTPWSPPEPFTRGEYEQVRAEFHDRLKEALQVRGKMERRDALAALKREYIAQIPEEDDERRSKVKKIISALEDSILREVVLGEGRRLDGRRLDEIRAIEIEVGLLPRTHGSSLFTRGETQALVSATLGTRRDAQIVEEYEGETLQKFMLHYNFPPFCVGEVKFLRGPSRREIGHGVLARRALMPLLPHEDDFPYTVRLVSDILESNGSSSMATVCGGSLALFDAGVPMLGSVAGVAMGLIKEGDRFAVLSDIAGLEDHSGDMDFKVAGTREGVTALQMDIKIAGVDRQIMALALEQARAGRFHILGLMEAVLPRPRSEISSLAPRLYTLQIPREKIRDVIGPGGKTIRSITEETGCEVEIDNDGKVVIAAPDGLSASRAREIIEKLTEVPQLGKLYTGQVRRIESYGAFVEILPGTDGLLHISELEPYRVKDIFTALTEGDEIKVKVISIDEGGKIRLSRKAVILEDPSYDPASYQGLGEPEEPGSARPDREDRGRGPRSEHGRPPRGGRGRHRARS